MALCLLCLASVGWLTDSRCTGSKQDRVMFGAPRLFTGFFFQLHFCTGRRPKCIWSFEVWLISEMKCCHWENEIYSTYWLHLLLAHQTAQNHSDYLLWSFSSVLMWFTINEIWLLCTVWVGDVVYVSSCSLLCHYCCWSSQGWLFFSFILGLPFSVL